MARKTSGRRPTRAKARTRATAKRLKAEPRSQRRDPFNTDQPEKRVSQLLRDRRFGSEGQNLAQLRLEALHEAETARRDRIPARPSPPGAGKWVQLGPTATPKGQTPSSVGGGARVNVSGRITELLIDPGSPSTMYAATAGGGVWRTLDGGVTWFAKSDQEASLAIGALAMAPSDASRLYAGTGEGNIFYYVQALPLQVSNEDYHGVGVLRSSDGGDSWTHVASAGFIGAAFYRIAVHPTNPDVLFAATTVGLMRSQDGGVTWTAMTNGLPPLSTTVIACTDVAYHPDNPSRAWCGFWRSGVYRTDNAEAATPTWTQLTTGLPATAFGRIALAVAPSDHDSIFAFLAPFPDLVATPIGRVYESQDGGDTWSAVTTTLPAAQSSYNLNIAVDVSTPDVLYLSSRLLHKVVRSGSTWGTPTEIGAKIHVDHHAFASHPTNHLQVYAGTDGGIFRSMDGGTTWDDTINEGLTITQFEFIGQHPTSDALVIGGTQDNGTAMFRNSPVFYHAADFDGGQAGMDPADPNNVIHTFSSLPRKTVRPPGTGIERSVAGGKFGTYTDISDDLPPADNSAAKVLFFPPWTYDDTNSQNLAFGTNELRLSAAQGTDKWPVAIPLSGTGDFRVSAIHYVSSSLIYCGTTNGLVFEATKSGSTWTAAQIGAAPLPQRWIWDISLIPGTSGVVILSMAGFGTGHVFKGTSAGGTWTWTDISGTAPQRLPDAPVNALQLDPTAPDTIYAGTEFGVWVTTDGGATWNPFSQGLPNVAIYDLKLHAPTRLLRAATHGRGLWERALDAVDPDVRLLLRDHVMDTGRTTPSPSGLPSAWEDVGRQINLGDPLFWWNCADVKVDAPVAGAYQMPAATVDYLAFETSLEHRNPQRGRVNRVYVQVHNRGVVAASNVVVKALWAEAAPGLPDLPADFWTVFPADSAMPSPWTPIGPAQTVASLRPERPAVLEWDWTPPMSAAAHSCLLVIASCAQDPPPVQSLAIDSVVTQNRQVGLKNLHIIDALAPAKWGEVHFAVRAASDVFRFSPLPKGWSLRLLLPKEIRASKLRSTGFEAKAVSASEQASIVKQLGKRAALYDLKEALTATASREGCAIGGLPVRERGIPILVAFTAAGRAAPGSVQLVQEGADHRVIGGNTFVLRPGVPR